MTEQPVRRCEFKYAVVTAFAATCAAVLPATAKPESAPKAASPSPCRVQGFRQEVQCGGVHRALDPDQPQGAGIDIHYVLVPAIARHKRPDPVFLFAGGPGQSAISVMPKMMGLFTRLNFRRDIVFVDQRGTGKSAPLTCDDVVGGLEKVADTDIVHERLDKCRRALQKLPYGDLKFFTTEIAVRDLDAVRAQIGADKINLVGASYGTRAALEYMRQFPQHVRRAVLDGAAPPDMALPLSFSADSQAAFDKMFSACEMDAACKARYPQLREEWNGLLSKLPRRITAADPATGVAQEFILTRDHLLQASRISLYMPTLASALPAAVHEASSGRFEPLLGLASALQTRSPAHQPANLAVGMHFSVVCAEDYPLLTDARAAAANPQGKDFGDQQQRFYARACAEWPKGKVSSGFYSIPVSNAPVLLLSGGDDPATPPRHGERVAKALGPQAMHVVAPHAGHGVMSVACGPSLMARFIADEDPKQAVQRDVQCLSDMPRPLPFLPAKERKPS